MEFRPIHTFGHGHYSQHLWNQESTNYGTKFYNIYRKNALFRLKYCGSKMTNTLSCINHEYIVAFTVEKIVVHLHNLLKIGVTLELCYYNYSPIYYSFVRK